jgi:hypothetical protein
MGRCNFLCSLKNTIYHVVLLCMHSIAIAITIAIWCNQCNC